MKWGGLVVVVGVDLKTNSTVFLQYSVRPMARCYVLFIFLFFRRSLQSSGIASKLAFFDAFPLEKKKEKDGPQ